jgi:hypothetical protein
MHLTMTFGGARRKAKRLASKGFRPLLIVREEAADDVCLFLRKAKEGAGTRRGAEEAAQFLSLEVLGEL